MSNETTASDRGVAIGGDVTNSTIITGDVILPPKPPTPHQLRKPLDDFVGREKEIAELLGILRKGGRASLSGISGMGGIGKTELALIVADRLRGDYPDAQLFLEMRGTEETPLDPAEALASCIRAFEGLEVRLPDDVGELNKIYLSLLNDKRALVVLDNAANRDQVKWLVPPVGCALLVTSRNVIAGMERVTLDQLKPEEARELLISISARITPKQADQISCLCGYLPLAIRAAGSLLDVTADLGVPDYILELSDERTRLEAIGTEGVEIGVEASFNLSYARLEPEAARVFRGLSVFPGSFDARAEEGICEDTGHKHLSELVKRSLALFEPAEQRYRLHDLARLYAGSRSSKSERLAYQYSHAEHYLQVLNEADLLYLEGGEAISLGLALFDRERGNTHAGWEWAKHHSRVLPQALELCDDYPNWCTAIAELRYHPRERIARREVALAAAQKLDRKESQAVHLGNLGIASFDLGDYQVAIKHYDQWLAICVEIGDRKQEGQVLNNLGNAHACLGQTQKALEFYAQSLPISQEFEDRRTEANTLGNMGSAFLSLGDCPRSIEFYEKSQSLMRETGDLRGESHSLLNLGHAHSLLGEAQRSLDCFKQALAIAHKIDDPYTMSGALWKIAILSNATGNNIQAIACAESALSIFEQIEHPWAAKVREALAEWRGEGRAANE